ncbi:MAG: hypothetical protein KAR06_12085, partial [Deltaproteobacteria bacterium]|nr:hypothetical protein [Deltaproteobacteria bacterium]
IKSARKFRLELKDARCAVENRRKEQKKEIVYKGGVIDTLATKIKDLITPIEAHLQKQEDFVKRIEEERLDTLEIDRKALLTQAGVENFSFYDLRRMPGDQFNELVTGAKETQRLKKEEAVKIEQEKVRKEKEQKEQDERIAKENERLKAEAEEREKAEAKAQEKRDFERRVQANKEAKEKEKQDKTLAEEKKKADAEKAKREALEKEIADKEEREAKERKVQADLEAKKKRDAEFAPDREKLMALAVAIAALEMPKVKSVEAKDIIGRITEALSKAIAEIKEGVNQL